MMSRIKEGDYRALQSNTTSIANNTNQGFDEFQDSQPGITLYYK